MIVILTQCYPPKIGGIENLIFNLSYYLSKHEKVIVLADGHNDIQDTEFDKNYLDNLQIKRFGGIKFFRKRNKNKELKKIISFHSVKAIISDSWKSLEYPITQLKKKKIPTYSLVHGNEIIIKNKKHHDRIFNTLSNVDKIICNSNFTLELLKKINPTFNNTEVIYPGVMDFEKIKEQSIDNIKGQPVILTLARLEKRKGHAEILKAIAALKDNYNKICYIIAGDGEELNNLKKLCLKLKIEKNVKFISSINDNQKKFIFKKTDIMVMPTIDETDNRSIEGFGISYIEAALFGVPSIASNVGGTPEAVIHNKTGIIIDKMKDLKINIEELIKNENKRLMLGENAKKRALIELNWKDQIKKYISLFSNNKKT